MGMNGADVLTVVNDPSGQFGSYEVGNVDEAHGTIDQDRLAALRGIDGELPPAAPVKVHVVNSDTGATRIGETDVVKQSTDGDSLFAFLAPFTVASEQDSALDEFAGGLDRLGLYVHGAHAKGHDQT